MNLMTESLWGGCMPWWALPSPPRLSFLSLKKWGWYALFALMALYTHHFAVFTVLAQGIWFLATGFSWHKRSKWLKELRPFLIVGLGYSFWLYPMYLQIQRVKGSGFWLAVPKLADLSGLIYRLASGGAAWHIPVAIVGVVFLLVKDWQKVWKNWLGLLFIFSAPVFFSYVVSQVVTPIFYDRYLLSAVVGAGVLLVLSTRRRFIWIVGVLLLVYGLLSARAFGTPLKRPFREFAADVKTEVKPGDYLLNWNGRAP